MFDYDVKKFVNTISDYGNGYTMEVNIISYNGGTPKIDIRKWDRNRDRMLKGIALTEVEAKKLKESLEMIV